MKEYGIDTVSCAGPSMEPTIIDGSHTCVLIERWSHRIFGLETTKKTTDDIDEEDDDAATLSESWTALLHGIWKQHFTSGLQHGDVIVLHHPSENATLCKRIIGLPGDTIVRTDGGSGDNFGYNHNTNNNKVTMSRKHLIVPPGHLWIEGDNCYNSRDSRSYGSVPASLVIGKVICRLWPLRDYVSLGIDGNGIEHWKRVNARIGRGDRPTNIRPGGNSNHPELNGSYVLTK